MAERSQASPRSPRELSTRVAQAVPAAAAILLALAVLAGLDGLGLPMSPLRALAWAALSSACGILAFVRGHHGSGRLLAQLAVAISIVALSAALIDVFAFYPCGHACLNR